MTITRDTIPPLSGVAGDVFVDQLDDDKIYLALSDFDVSAVNASVTIPASSRPAAALTVSARTAGHFFATVAIVDGGASGTATVAGTGSGTRTDPYVCTITAFDDSNSNNDLIAALSTDAYLEGSGASATDGSVTAVAALTLDNGVGAGWTLREIRIQYDAEHPGVFSLSDTLPASLPLPMRNALPEYLSARLSSMFDGGDLNKATVWAGMWRQALEKSRRALNAGTFPTGVRPG